MTGTPGFPTVAWVVGQEYTGRKGVGVKKGEPLRIRCRCAPGAILYFGKAFAAELIPGIDYVSA